MKVLILGSINSQWTFQFVVTFLRKNNYEVWILKREKGRKSEQWIAKYRKNGVHVIDCTDIAADIEKSERTGDFLGAFRGHIKLLRKVVKTGCYDVINLQYVVRQDVVYAPILKYLMNAKLVFSYWGSDLLRCNDRQLRFGGRFARRADFITFDNRDLELMFRKTYRWASKVPLKTILFGLPVLDIIREKLEEKTQEDIRQKWGIPKEKTVIAIGYSATEAHQHIKILEQIRKLDSAVKEKIFLLLQMTYNGTPHYIRRVTDMAKETSCEYKVIRHFLDDYEVADLRIMTDIYVNAQTTDAFSGSVCENLFAGTILINAKWLRYQEFKDYNFKFLEFRKIDEIGQLIKIAMKNEMDVSENKELVWQLRSWECCEPKWERMFQFLSQKNEKKRR